MKSYVVPDGSYSDKTNGENKWLVLRVKLDFKGQINGGDMVPFDDTKPVPSFNIIGIDKKSIKDEVCKQIDIIFEENKEPNEQVKYICSHCGEVKPKVIYYSFPSQADCPKCNRRLESSQKFNILSKEDAVKMRPSFYNKDNTDDHDSDTDRTIE